MGVSGPPVRKPTNEAAGPARRRPDGRGSDGLPHPSIIVCFLKKKSYKTNVHISVLLERVAIIAVTLNVGATSENSVNLAN